MPRLKGYRFALSTADVEDLLAERGIIVSREAIRLWVNRFGTHFATCIRRERPRPNDKWHLVNIFPRLKAGDFRRGQPSFQLSLQRRANALPPRP